MRHSTFLRLSSVALIACLVAAPALAAPPNKAEATFEPLAASGISGQARLQSLDTDQTLIHVSLRGLEPNAEYVSVIFQNASCVPAGSDLGMEFITFTANPAGIANYNIKVPHDLSVIGSLAVWPEGTQTAVACGAVTPVE